MLAGESVWNEYRCPNNGIINNIAGVNNDLLYIINGNAINTSHTLEVISSSFVILINGRKKFNT